MIYAFLLAIAILGIPRLYVILSTSQHVFTVETAPKMRVAVVFGAGLQRDGTPSPVLRDRVATAADLYFKGKAEKLLMSGDNRFEYYNEPGSMYEYAVSLGIPTKDIVLDYAGRRTYDTCYRAKEIFGVSELLLVTQTFHLPRALFTCEALGITAYGINADRREYLRSSIVSWQLREIPATITAMWDVWVTHPEPVLGKKEPIFPENTSKIQSDTTQQQ